MEDRIRRLRLALSAVFAALTALWGWFGWLVMSWAVCMALDVLTGMAAGAKAGAWTSNKAREGLWHKAGCVAAVAIAGVLDLVVGQLVSGLPEGALPFSYDVFLCPMTVTWYILTEVGSIIENVGAMGAPVPGWLRKAVASLRDKLDEQAQQ